MDIADRWMTSNEAARYLGYSEYTLKRARCDGYLGGKKQPNFTKAGKAVRYQKSDLDAWMTGGNDE